MKTILPICAGSLLMLLTGCTHDSMEVRSPFLRQQVFSTSSGERRCALHAAPLITTNGFALSQHIHPTPDPDYVQIGSWYPNHVGRGKSLRASEDYDEQTQLIYCPQCDAEYERACELYRKQSRGRGE